MLNERLNSKEVLTRFAEDVIHQAQVNKLSAVAQSLEYDLEVGPNSFSLEFKALPYADFVDQGVKGKDSSAKAPSSPYRFGSGSHKGTGKQFEESINDWIRRRGLRLRDENGKFVKGGRKTLSFLIRRSIYTKGLRPSLFFTKAFEQYFPTLPPELTEAYALDAEEMIEYTFREHLK
jgi:hypothetical protein